MSQDGPRWYVVQAQPHGENKAVAHLERQGFGAYLPRYLKKRRHARRIDFVAAPLFPRYLFVSFDMSVHRWRSIYSTVGVSRLVCVGDSPTPVAEGIVEGLQKREIDGLVKLENRPQFQVGDPVRIVEGAFTDCLGLYDGYPDNDRVRILLDLLGRKVRVTVDADGIVAA
jgi:transcriptional antiterminator RfaH